MKKRIVILLSFLLLGAINYGQENRATLEERYEIDAKVNDFIEFTNYNLGDQTLLNVTSEKIARNTYEWKFRKLDKNLNLLGEDNVILPKDNELVAEYLSPTHFHLLFRYGFKGSFTVVSFNLSTNKMTKVEGKLSNYFKMTKFEVFGDNLLIDTKIKRRPYLTVINWKTGKFREIPIEIEGAKSKRINFLNIQVLKDKSEAFVFVSARVNKKTDTYAMSLDKGGNTKDILNLTANYKEVISEIMVSKISDKEYIYTGNYSKDYLYAHGVFIGKSVGKSVPFFKFYNFLSLSNFYDFASDKEKNKIERKKKRKKKKGKELKANYLVATHELIEKEDKFIFLGEAYIPTYNQVRTVDANGKSTYTRVFDGFLYTHAFIIAFDKKGELIWDNSFEIRPNLLFKPMKEVKFVSISSDSKEELTLVFSSFNSIKSKKIGYSSGETTEERNSELISTGDDGDKTKVSSAWTIHWYGDTFITFGYQKIKNNTGSEKRKRKVYFINKIRF